MLLISINILSDCLNEYILFKNDITCYFSRNNLNITVSFVDHTN